MLLYNPQTKDLTTEDGTFLKHVRCPKLISGSDLEIKMGVAECTICKKSVIELDNMTEKEAISLFKKSPTQCVKFSLNSPNISVAPNAT